MNDILIVDDERDIRELISDILVDEGYSTRLAANSGSAMRQMREHRPMMLILDIWLKDSSMDGIDILKSVKINYPEVPVVIISGHGNIEIAVAAIKQGAFDFIEKPFNLDQLIVTIRRAVEVASLRLENSVLKNQYREPLELNGQSAVYKILKGNLDKVAKSNGRVLITGQYGSGKETAARYIHGNSNRSNAPMILVNCDALLAETADSALFGIETEVQGLETGFFEKAQGGILFFDEIGALPLSTQSRLLRALVDQYFVRVDGSEKIKINVRIISTSARDLKHEIQIGNFREELYHRLNVVSISIPSLEERREDIPLLAEYFLEEFNQKLNLPKRSLTEEAAARLLSMAWPGNIRQLRNIIERILIMGPHHGLIEVDELPKNEVSNKVADDQLILSDSVSTMSLRDARELFEREYLLAQINRFGGNISRTAKFVGMERSALHRKLKSLGVVSVNKGGGE
jgi:two-component system nitrogen regulation response regulator NtrX